MHAFVINMMAFDNEVTMNTRGMITIPKSLRDEYNLKPGMKFSIMKIDGCMTIIPIQSREDFFKDLVPHGQIQQSIDASQERELELEQ